jgi:uncharacterized protein involved in copper resistance
MPDAALDGTPEVAPAPGAESPDRDGLARTAARAARRRIALFLLVLLVAGGAAWGAGRLMSQTLEPAPAPMDPGMDHRMQGGEMMPGMDMPGMDMSGMQMPGTSR